MEARLWERTNPVVGCAWAPYNPSVSKIFSHMFLFTLFRIEYTQKEMGRWWEKDKKKTSDASLTTSAYIKGVLCLVRK